MTKDLEQGHAKDAASNVALQASLMDRPGTAWHAIKYGNVEVRLASGWIHGDECSQYQCLEQIFDGTYLIFRFQ